MAIKINLVIDQNSDYANSFSISNSGITANLTSYTTVGSFKEFYESNTTNTYNFTTSFASNSISIALPANVSNTISPGLYVWNVKFSNANTGSDIRVFEGLLTLTPDIS